MDNIYSKNQIFLFDNLKGIAIFLIFLHHSPADILAEPFLMVMMPVFAFVSGYSKRPSLNIRIQICIRIFNEGRFEDFRF